MIWVTSDTHFWHKNIIKYANRRFVDLEEMNGTIKYNWNRVVKKDDIIFHLGDFALGSRTRLIETANELNGHKVLVAGNHDMKRLKELAKCFEVIYIDNFILETDRYHILMTHRRIKTETNMPTINVSVENWNYTPIPLPTTHDWIQLCGHSHDTWIARGEPHGN